MERVKLLVTGGHLTPAMALIDEVSKSRPAWDIVFVGRSTVFEGGSTQSEEERIMLEKKIPFVSLTAGRLRRVPEFATITSFLKIPRGMLQAFFILRRQKPDAVVSFGGYIAFPLAAAAWIQGIPVVTHEQTMSPGLANRMIARFAAAVCVSYPQTAGAFGSRNVTVTGLPIRSAIYHPPERSRFFENSGSPVLYVTGGATGSVQINALIFSCIKELLGPYRIVHQTGRLEEGKAREVRNALPEPLRSRYFPVPYVDETEHAWLLHHASAAVSRAGANTVAEFAAVGMPAVLIPIENASGNEQVKNAQWLAGKGYAQVLTGREVGPGRLMDALVGLMKKPRTSAQVHESSAAALLLDAIERSIG